MAEYLGLKADVIPLRYAPTDIVPKVATLYGQPFADSSAVPSYVIAQAARRHRKVVLTGDGGDEVFAGYRRYLLARVARWCGQRPGRAGWLAGRLGTSLGSLGRRRSSVGFVARGLRGAGLNEAERYLAELVQARNSRAPSLQDGRRSSRTSSTTAYRRAIEPSSLGCDRVHHATGAVTPYRPNAMVLDRTRCDEPARLSEVRRVLR